MSRKTAEGLTTYFQSLLDSEGFNRGQVSWDDNAQTSDLVFKVEGRGFVLIADADDEDFVRLVFPNFWSLDNDEEFASALQAISIINGRCKGAKLYTASRNDEMMAAIEFLIPATNPQMPARLFMRYIRMLNHAAEEFSRVMKEFSQSR